MSKPLHVTPETMQHWRLDSVIDELLGTEPASREGKSARTLVKGPALTIVLTVLREGHRLHEHHVPAPAMVIPLRGEVIFTHGDQRTTIAAEGLSVLMMGPGRPHAAEARTDSAFLLVIGTRD